MVTLRGLYGASKRLAGQGANVVFYKRAPYQGRALNSEVECQGIAHGFRRGVMPVGVPREFIKSALDEGLGDSEILFSLRDSSWLQIKKAFQAVLREHVPVEEAFEACQITARKNFIRVLLIAAYGAFHEMRVIDPQYGVENLSHFLLRNTDFVDSRVYNPNLAGLKNLRHLFSKENFNVIGMSPIVLYNDIEIMAMAKELNPQALLVTGGPFFATVPPELFLQSFPADLVVRGAGEYPLKNIVEAVFEKGASTAADFKDMPGLWIYDNGKIIFTGKTNRRKNKTVSLNPQSADVPLREEDIYHQMTYLAKRGKIGMVPGDHIGLKPIVVVITDHCRGKCIFCNTPKNLMILDADARAASVKKTVQSIKEKWNKTEDGQLVYDAVQIIDNNFSVHRDVIEEFCREVIEQDLAHIPKSCKARIDEMCVDKKSSEPDKALLGLMAEAGFKRIYYGNESFIQDSLDNMHKQITVEQNENVLQATLDAGIIPGMNIIVFGGINDSPRDVLHTVRRELHFVERGATVNTSEYIGAEYGMPVMDIYPDRITYETWHVLGMRAPYKEPYKLFTNQELDMFAEKALAKKDDFIRFLQYQYPFQTFSTQVNALSLFWAVAHLLSEDDLAEKAEWLIDLHICEQSRNIVPYRKEQDPVLRNMRYAFIDRRFGETIHLYNQYLRQLFEENSDRFRSSNVDLNDLIIDPLRKVLDISSFARDLRRLMLLMENKKQDSLRMRLAGYPATGKTMLRNQLIKNAIELEIVDLDRYRIIPEGQAPNSVWQESINISQYYDLSLVAEDFKNIPSDGHLLYEGTWVLSPEFSGLANWDFSLGFNFPAEAWKRALWFRQILFRRKEPSTLLPSPSQLRLYEETQERYVSAHFSKADLVLGETGEILHASRKGARALKQAGIEKFESSFFIDQLGSF